MRRRIAYAINTFDLANHANKIREVNDGVAIQRATLGIDVLAQQRDLARACRDQRPGLRHDIGDRP